jgi:hypothetical protein
VRSLRWNENAGLTHTLPWIDDFFDFSSPYPAIMMHGSPTVIMEGVPLLQMTGASSVILNNGADVRIRGRSTTGISGTGCS